MYIKYQKKCQTHTRMCFFAIYIIGHIVPPRYMHSLSLFPSLPPSLSRARSLSVSLLAFDAHLSTESRARALSLSVRAYLVNRSVRAKHHALPEIQKQKQSVPQYI
jgi:hypothetical protein